MIVKNVLELIGSTPMVEITDKKNFGNKLQIFAKLEYLNPFGSLKDRIAWEMTKNEIKNWKKEEKIIIENSSGNTAKALAIIASIYGLKFKIITNRIKFLEKKDVLKILKADIKELPGKSQCLDPNDPYDPQFFIEKEIEKNPKKYVFTNQYFNQNNVIAHLKTAQEIDKDLNGKIDYFISGIGTAGSTLGIKKYFEKKKKKIKLIGVIAEKGETIPGIRNEKELLSVGHFKKENYDEIIPIAPDEAVKATLELIYNFGIITGPTGGASFAAIKKRFSKSNLKANIVFLACDRFEFYLSYFRKMLPQIFEEERKNLIKEDKKTIIDEEQFKKIINKNNFLLVDIRSNFAYKIKSLKKSINIPEAYLEEMIEKEMEIFPKDKEIIFICPFGERSVKYASYFKSKGYKSYSLKEGFYNLKNV